MKLFEYKGLKASPVIGEVGIELECEFKEDPFEHIGPKGWDLKRDNSLRGVYSGEFVLIQPCKRDRVNLYLKRAYKFFKDIPPEESENCSAHIHINVNDMEFRDIVTYVCLYYILEPMLMKLCGDLREGNEFCLSLSEAEYVLEKFLDFIESKNFGTLDKQVIKYSALNLSALKHFGSLEFRGMRFPVDREELSTWINILLELKDSVKLFPNPVVILETFSQEGLDSFIKKVLPTYHKMISPEGLEDDIFYQMHAIQVIVSSKYIDKDTRPEYQKNRYAKIKAGDLAFKNVKVQNERI